MPDALKVLVGQDYVFLSLYLFRRDGKVKTLAFFFQVSTHDMNRQLFFALL